MVLENRSRSDPASPAMLAPLFTPAEKFRVSLSAPPTMLPPERTPLRNRVLTGSAVNLGCSLQEVTRRCRTPSPQRWWSCGTDIREKISLPSPKSTVAPYREPVMLWNLARAAAVAAQQVLIRKIFSCSTTDGVLLMRSAPRRVSTGTKVASSEFGESRN